MDGAFLQSASSIVNGTVYTFASQSLGAADAGRYIVVGFASRTTTGVSGVVTSLTVGGVSASILDQGSFSNQHAGMAIAAVPTGTTGDIVVTFDGEQQRAAIFMYRLVDIDSATPSDLLSSTSLNPSVALDVPEGGFAIGVAGFGFGDGSTAWTGLTEDADLSVESSMNGTSASDSFETEQVNLTITANSSVNLESVGVFASWAPAAGGGGINADVPVAAVGYGASVPTSAKSPAAPLGQADYAALAPASAKAAGLAPAACAAAAIAPASSKSATAPRAASQTAAIAPSVGTASSVPLGSIEYAALAPTSSKSASLAAVGVEIVALVPTSTIDEVAVPKFPGGGTFVRSGMTGVFVRADTSLTGTFEKRTV